MGHTGKLVSLSKAVLCSTCTTAAGTIANVSPAQETDTGRTLRRAEAVSS
jgi:hypothetical protein